MANDRMFLVNKLNGRWFMIAKHMGGGWFLYTDRAQEYVDGLQELFNDCHDEFFKDSHAWEIKFEDN